MVKGEGGNGEGGGGVSWTGLIMSSGPRLLRVSANIGERVG